MNLNRLLRTGGWGDTKGDEGEMVAKCEAQMAERRSVCHGVDGLCVSANG